MKKTMLVAATLLLFLLPGAACFGEPAESYYPLKEGTVWVYGVTSSKPGAQKITVTNQAPGNSRGRPFSPGNGKWAAG